jgi:hypothetical protein
MPVSLATLFAANRELFGGRWTKADLEELLQPRHGVISGFEAILADLSRITSRDLDDVPPREPGWRGKP